LFISFGHSHLKLIQVAGVSSAALFVRGKHWGLGKSNLAANVKRVGKTIKAAEPHKP
jgi:hypothetical protein